MLISMRSEPQARTLRPIGMTSLVRVGVSVLVCASLSGCSESDGGLESADSGGDDCVSFYESVAQGATWPDLHDAIMRSTKFGHVASVRTQARGHDVGAGAHPAVRVIDLLNRKEHRLVQADVWRTNTGAWAAGVWNQCID
jgi:hypothetical protein